jgi:predicted nucleic acid-binding protein
MDFTRLRPPASSSQDRAAFGDRRDADAELNQQRTPDLVRSWLAGAPEWLHVQAPIQGREDLRRGLGAGEREAIALAAELSADALPVDDRDARHEAEN